MPTAKWTIQPGLLPTLAAVLVLSGLLALGVWQLNRAEQKERLYETYIQRSQMPPVDLNREAAALDGSDDLLWRRAQASGQYTGNATFLLDNQVLNGAPGYFVFTPFELNGKPGRILVNRGWIPAGSYRHQTPDIETPGAGLLISGTLSPPPPRPAFLDGAMAEDMGGGITRIQYLDPDDIGQRLGRALAPYVMRLDAGSSAGYTRSWRTDGSGSERHLGYAFQWFALAAAAVVIFVSLNIRRGGRIANGR
jgi:surfeit locus 1 family protein